MAPPTLVALQSTPSWLPRTSTWLHAQVAHLPKDVESHVVCNRTENLDQFPWPSVERRKDPERRGFLAKLLRPSWTRFVTRAAKRRSARLIHSHWGDHGCRDVEAARKAGLAHVVTFYGKDVGFLPRSKPGLLERYREMFGSVDRVLCEGPHMGRCIAALGCPDSKIEVQHLGVDVRKIEFRPRRWEGGTLRFFLAGSFREKKGFPDALEAIGLLHRELKDLEVTVIGDASDDPRSGPEKERILAAIERHGLGPRTKLLGYQPWAVFFREAYASHVFVSPSVTASDGDTEGGAPVSLIDLAATGMPIVSSTHCDIPSVILHGRTGLLAGEHDVPGLLAHLRFLVANPGRWLELVEAGRRHVEQEYDVHVQGERLGAIYRRLVAERGHAAGAGS
jgi:colanic acid/amylovoran biosynthesis glycosyltransferase